MQDREGWKLPCEKCGAVIQYDGVSLSDQPCPHCGAKRPHTLKGNPLLPFLFFFGGWLAFGLINPFDWSENVLLFGSGGSLLLLVWFKVFLPMHIGLWRLKRENSGNKERRLGIVPGCLSVVFFLFGLVCLSIFCFQVKTSSSTEMDSDQARGDYVFRLEGHEVTDGIDSVPLSPVGGNATKIGFINRAEFPVEVHWLDHNGTLHYLARLGQDHGQNAKAFVGQTWLVSDGDGTPLLYYVAEKETPDGAFGKGNFTRD